MVNADNGKFTLTFGGATDRPARLQRGSEQRIEQRPEKLEALSSIGTGNVTVAGSVGATRSRSAAELSPANVGDITADNSQLTGVFNDANLTDAASFSVSLTNQSAAMVAITQTGQRRSPSRRSPTAAVGSASTRSTNGAGAANEVQTVPVRAAPGPSRSASAGGRRPVSPGHLRGRSAAALGSLLSIGSGNVAVSQSTTVGGTLYTITFQGTLADANQQQIVPSSTSGLTAQNELRQLTATGAAGGSYKLAWDSNSDGTSSPARSRLRSPTTPRRAPSSRRSPGRRSAGERAGGAGRRLSTLTITFQGGLGGMNVKPVAVNDTSALTSPERDPAGEPALRGRRHVTLTWTAGRRRRPAIAWNAARRRADRAERALQRQRRRGQRQRHRLGRRATRSPSTAGRAPATTPTSSSPTPAPSRTRRRSASFDGQRLHVHGGGCETLPRRWSRQLQAAIDTAAINGGPSRRASSAS